MLMGMRNKYVKLTEWMSMPHAEPLRVTFAQLDALVGGLPPSALRDRNWWGNTLGNSQSAAWLKAGWLVQSVELRTAHATFVRGAHRPRSDAGLRPARTGAPRTTWARDPILHGATALDDLVVRAGWSSVEAVVAANTVFLHPDTVAQAGSGAVFPVVRDPTRRGQLGELPDGRKVLFDDNATPTDVFLWAANRIKGPDVQFNHVWSRSKDPDSYTALWNLCCTPAFLAKTSDSHPGVVSMLRYRSYDLYGVLPEGVGGPLRPGHYGELTWAAMPPTVDDLEAVFRARMRSAPLRRASVVARTIGWVFSDGPDIAL
ncbi:unannotated protein [freshwater metagenome]|uniref:Unannotated protein n=1 Tax=freshwater metagenome TaxID=449393 RepID=A0A6J7AUX4_9ZZZZ|nr:hypothetical protein [Actinomycetota bacterium]